MAFIPFDEKELMAIGTKRGSNPAAPSSPKLNTPISARENFLRVLRHESPYWIPFVSDKQSFSPRIFPDNLVCGLVNDGETPLSVSDYSGTGWFGTEWKYVEEVRGATTIPGKAQIQDVNDWKAILKFPDIHSYDWNGSAKANEHFFDRDLLLNMNMLCGYWERLMALMDVTDGAIAMIDEDCTESVHSLFDALTDLYIETVDYCYKYYSPELILWHDDWGTQRAPFFTVETIDEMIIPHLKRLIDHIHSKGMYFELHSCGQNEQNVPLMIKAGVDMWNGQPMNDKEKLANLYSKDIIIGVDMPQITTEMSEADITNLADEFFEKYKDLRICISDRNPDPVFTRRIYRRSREYYR